MIGSTLSACQSPRYISSLGYVRYATTMESFRSIASSTTALVRSTVRSAEFIWRRNGSKGASSSTDNRQLQLNSLTSEGFFAHTPSIIPTSIRQRLRIPAAQLAQSFQELEAQSSQTYSFLIALTTALEKGAAAAALALIVKARRRIGRNIDAHCSSRT